MFRRLIDINITGTFIVAQAVGQAMIKAKTGGSIINIASMSGTVVNYPQEQSCYNASKAGVVQLTKSLAAEWARHNIRVNSISPGVTVTPMTQDAAAVPGLMDAFAKGYPLGRYGTPDDIAAGCVWLASDECFMTGENLQVNGGLSLRGNPTKEAIDTSVAAAMAAQG